MKILELSPATDDKKLFRDMAEMTLEGAKDAPAKTLKVELYPATVEVDSALNETAMVKNPITKEAIATLLSKLRNGLASVDMGRFSVKLEGNIAEVSVSTRAPRVVKKKAAEKTAEAPKATPAAKKAAKA